MLHVFAQEVRACLGQWPLESDKSTEPEVLEAHRSELFERYPALRMITGDALYAQRNLAELTVASERDYLFQLKGNQPDALDAAQTSLGEATDAEAAVKTVEDKGQNGKSSSLGQLGRRRHVRERLGFAGCRMLLRVDRRTMDRRGRTTCETRYFMTSLDPTRVTQPVA